MGENRELVREGFEAWRRGDVERALEHGLLQMYADWTADFEEFEMEPLEYVEMGDWVLVDMVQRGTGRASGVTVGGRFWMAYEVSDGKVTRQDAFLTREQALEAASPPL